MKKLEERCKMMEMIVMQLAEIYENEANADQKKFIETMVGAAIFYLPHNEKYWTGKISENAYQQLKMNGNTRLTKEHQFPRKIAAKQLLTTEIHGIMRGERSLQSLYEEKYAKYNLVLPQENKKITKFQKDGLFNSIEEAYDRAGIALMDISREEINALKKK